MVNVIRFCKIFREKPDLRNLLTEQARKSSEKQKNKNRINKRLKESEREEREFRKLGELADREKAKADKEIMKNTAPQKLDDTQIENEEKKDEANNNEEESNDQSTFKSKFSGFQFNLNLNLSQAQKALKVDEPSEGKVNESKNDNNKPFAASELIQNDQQMNKREQKDMSKPKSNLDVLLKMVDQSQNYKKNSKYEDKYKRQKISEKQDDEVKVKPNETDGDEPWLVTGIIVKILQKSLGGGKFYKNTGRVYKIVSNNELNPNSEFGFQGNIKMLSGPGKGTKLSIDQAYLEPIIPKINPESPINEVMVIKGKYKGKLAMLTEIDVNDKTGILKLKDDETLVLKLNFDCFAEYQSKIK